MGLIVLAFGFGFALCGAEPLLGGCEETESVVAEVWSPLFAGGKSACMRGAGGDGGGGGVDVGDAAACDRVSA